MATDNEIRRNIKVKESTYQALAKQALHKGETFDAIIRRILEMHKINDKKMSKSDKRIVSKI